MKNILIHIIILIPFLGYSQSKRIPEIKWQDKTQSDNTYIDLLNLKDRNSLIVKISYSSYWTKGLNAEYIVYQNDGKVKRFIVYEPNSTEAKIKFNRKRIKKEYSNKYWEYLNKCVEEASFEIDKSKLNITRKKSANEDFFESMSVSDGTNYQFEICQGTNFISYHSYSPISYIEKEYPGSEERQKLVDLMRGFEQLNKKY